ncbi:ABC transporter permease [Candidatus Clostridium radicumherbarum]|uniref:ABC transporter permease n=1 Tax=Candidatus Clostridium radicumherbarum TaxID=3381662 RepID=A0ABW8TWI8_9CLOT
MAKYILKRIGLMIVTLWVVATLTFILINSIPGDPIMTKARVLPEATQKIIRAKYNLDKPLYVQYGIYIKNLLTGNMGESIIYPGRTVNSLLKAEFPVTLRLGLQAISFGLIVGLLLGIVAALKRNSWIDYLVILIAILGVSIPAFVLALLFQLGFGGKYGLPTVGWGAHTYFFTAFKYTLMPSLALSFGSIASFARYSKSSILDVVNQDYILTAKAKGVSQIPLTIKHILKNALVPVISVLGPRVAYVLMGSIVIEQIFAIPGIGRELVNSISNRDYTVIMSLTVFFAFIYIVAQLLADIAYVIVDPKMKLTDSKE